MNGRKNRDMISQKRKIGTIRRLGGGAFSQENGEGKAVQLVEKMIYSALLLLNMHHGGFGRLRIGDIEIYGMEIFI